jgi:molybdopterin converting factor small subunit
VRSDELAGETVGELLTHARARYGASFAEILDRSRIWVNGRNADADTPVAADDEVAVLPPVSGG